MIESSLGPVQAGVYAALVADSAGAGSLGVLLGGISAVLDSVPESTKLRKYIALAESIETPNDTFGSYGNDELFTIKMVVEDTQDQSGWKTAEAIDARVVELLDGPTLTIAGRAFIYCTREQAQKIHDPPWRVISRDFRIATEDPNS